MAADADFEDQIEDEFVALLRNHPDSAVGALQSNGLFVPVPPSIVLGDHTVLEGRSGIDLVEAGDRLEVARAWGEARELGKGRASVRLLDGRRVVCHLLDVRKHHGVWMMLFVLEPLGGPDEDEKPFLALPPIAPRVCTMLLEETSIVAAISPSVSGMLGWEPEDIIGLPSLELIHPDEHARAIDTWIAGLSAADLAHRMRCRYARKDGTWLWVELTMEVLTGADAGRVRNELVDISAEMQAHEALQSRERMLDRLTEALPSGVVQLDRTGEIVYRNDRVDQILGVSEASTLAELFAVAQAEDRAVLVHAINLVLVSGQDQDVEVHLVPAGRRRQRVCQVLMRPLIDDAGDTTGAIVCLSDVTESTVLRKELHMRATFDSLTDVHNRASVMGLLESALRRPPVDGSGIAVLFIDIDHFKLVNDRFGHSSGDHLLTVVADRLRGAIRDGDTIGRLGGDEFLVVCPLVASAEVTSEMAGRITAGLRGPVRLRGEGAVDLCVSLGAAWTAEPFADADALVARADAAMYESKREGIGRPVVVTYAKAAPAPA